MATISWEELCKTANPELWDEDPDTYEFSNGRKFKNKDGDGDDFYV